MCKLRGLAEKQILHHKKLHLLQRLVHFLQIRVGLRHVIPDDPEPLEPTRNRRVPHVGRFHAAFRGQRTAGDGLMQQCQLRIVQTLVAGEVGREAAHIRGPLHIVLSTQGIDAGARLSDVAGGQGEVTERDDPMTAPAMFRHTETMDAERRAAAPITPSRLVDEMGRHAGDGFSRFRRTVRDGLEPVIDALGPCRDEGLIEEPLLRQNVAHRIEQGDVACRVAVADADRPAAPAPCAWDR